MSVLDIPPHRSSNVGDYLYNFKATNFRKYRKALADTKTGTADTKILCVGDSRTEGQGGTGSPAQKTAWPAYLTQMGIENLPTVNDFYAPQPLRTDSRISRTGTWTTSTVGALAMGWGTQAGACLGYWANGAGGGGTLTYTPGGTNQYDKFDVYLVSGTFTGPATIQATGGSVVNVGVGSVGPFGGSDATIQKYTVTAAALSASNAVTISNTGSGQLIIVTIDPWNSTKAQVRVANSGIAGSYAQGWATVNGLLPSASAQNTIKAYGPHLALFDLGTNDSAVPRTNTQYLADMNALITAARVSGDVIVKSPMPLGGAQASRDPIIRGYADTIRATGVPFIDMHARIGDYTAYNTAGYFNGDGIHGNNYSYAETGAWMHYALRSI